MARHVHSVIAELKNSKRPSRTHRYLASKRKQSLVSKNLTNSKHRIPVSDRMLGILDDECSNFRWNGLDFELSPSPSCLMKVFPSLMIHPTTHKPKPIDPSTYNQWLWRIVFILLFDLVEAALKNLCSLREEWTCHLKNYRMVRY